VIEHVEDIHLMLEHMIVKALKEVVDAEMELPRPIALIDRNSG
jgi:hypothetical protein